MTFITGSHAYGIPHENSDVDLVLYMPPDEGNKLYELLKEYNYYQGTPYEGACSYCLKIGKLNLIICLAPELYDAWKNGTEQLKQIAPVTRDEAIAVLSKLRM